MLAHKQNPSPSTRDALWAARSKAQQTARRCANEYWQNLCAKIQLAADCGHAKGMYEDLKTATSPTSAKTAPRSNQRLARSSLIRACSCSVEWSIISSSTQPRTSSQTLPLMPCLGCQSQRSLTDTGRAQHSDCNNYRGISLLSIIGKVFARVTLTRLQSLASQVYPKSQCGFRAGRFTVDMIFSLRKLQEKCQEQQQPLFLAFVDLTKTFDLLSRSGLFKILQKIGCPPKLLAIITSFHQDMQSTVCFDGATSNAFPVSSGGAVSLL